MGTGPDLSSERLRKSPKQKLLLHTPPIAYGTSIAHKTPIEHRIPIEHKTPIERVTPIVHRTLIARGTLYGERNLVSTHLPSSHTLFIVGIGTKSPLSTTPGLGRHVLDINRKTRTKIKEDSTET